MLCSALAFFPLILSCLLMIPHPASLSPDGHILLKISKEDLRDPNNSLSNWDDSHQNPCAWNGISCDKFNTVTAVDLTGHSISGNFTSAICALPNLTVLTLHHNAFSGPFPLGLLHCYHLRKLELSLNKFAGMLPAHISQLSELRVLNSANNAFSDTIPISFGMLPKLEALFLHGNSLRGTFPSFVGNLESLTNFTIGSNPLRPGVIPRELGKLKQMQELGLENCSLVGGIPPFLGNLTQLRSLDISQNNLSGGIPTFLGNLTQLEELDISSNHLQGQIPGNIDQLRSLYSLNFCGNQLNGTIPQAITNLTNLILLQLCSNRLTGTIPAQLGELRYLNNLMLYDNEFNGWLPQNLGTYSNLIVADLSTNGLEGPLPTNLCMGGVLYGFEISSNNFNGSLPSTFKDCKSLRFLYIDNNQLSGEIPSGLWGAVNLQGLFLNNNKFPGKISPAIGQAKELSRLKISNNLFEGRIPAQVGQLKRLLVFEAGNNRLSGPIPRELGSLDLVNFLTLDHNFLSDDIPKEIMYLKNLSEFNLGHNRLTGEIPALFLSDITSLDLSNNFLSGGVPPELELSNIHVFNVSNNYLSGRIPDGLDNLAYKDNFVGSPGLCGGRNLMLPSCSSDQHNLPPRSLATLLSICLVVVLIAVCSVCLYRSFCYKKPKSTPLWKVTSFHSRSVDERDIFPNLKETNVIGSGSAGKVYKVHLQNGEAMVVKKVRNICRSVGSLKRRSDEKESKTGEVEVNTLGHIRHKNVLKLLCCISSEEEDFKLLVYEFMPNGSLFDHLHQQSAAQGRAGEWRIRYQIALGAARGLSYMHHDCRPPILHSNVKSSNILLDADFDAKIADFGVSRVLDSLGKAHSVSGYVGSHGYIAPGTKLSLLKFQYIYFIFGLHNLSHIFFPRMSMLCLEYAWRLKVNEKSDVYSFGVVLLELVTGMKATGEVEYGEDGNIVDWVCNTTRMGGEKMKVLDERTVEDNCVEQMLRVLHMGLVCTNREPNQRPSMKEVMERLEACGGHSREETVLGLERISSSHSESENEIVCFPDQQS